MKKIMQTVPSVSLLKTPVDGAMEDDPIIVMLEAIADNGSINQAAKAVGLSYKATWERIDTLNNLSAFPLVERRTGGSGGGGTALTEEGWKFLRSAREFRHDHAQLVSIFRSQGEGAFAMLQKLKGMEMHISARNVWLGNVRNIEAGPVNAIVEVALKGHDTIFAMITNSSVERLSLAKGKEVLAIVKAPDVILSHELDPDSITASNILTGPIERIMPGKINDEITVTIEGGNTVTAVITSESVVRLGLVPGKEVCAIIKASNVILALP